MNAVTEIENDWSVCIPSGHAELMMRPYNDPEVMKLGLLLAGSEIELLDIQKVNERLHDDDHPAPWPDEAFAFATNECGDYFAYYTDPNGRKSYIVYVNPGESPEQAIDEGDPYIFSSFDEWRSYKSRPASQQGAQPDAFGAG